MANKTKEIRNKKYNKLTAIKFHHKSKGIYYWIFKCDCGKKIIRGKKNVTSGQINSCGCSHGNLGKNNGMWKGSLVSYRSLHEWVSKKLLKPKRCTCCHKSKPYDLANKGNYNRDLKNWEWLCRKCHMKKDGRYKKLTKGLRTKQIN
ncbi:MAG: hypothetical protein WC679_14100 [Bacteroidales bacterium]|jgi:hypothetical protein